MTEWTSNHMRAPGSASFVAQHRQVFGNANVQVLYVKENGVELGQPDQHTYATVFQAKPTGHIEGGSRGRREVQKPNGGVQQTGLLNNQTVRADEAG